MRAVTRNFHKVEFVPSMLTPITGQIVRWNAHQESIAAKITTPLPVPFLSDLYTTMPMRTLRTAIAQDMREMSVEQWQLEEDDWIR